MSPTHRRGAREHRRLRCIPWRRARAHRLHSAILAAMKLYFAGPLFTTPERVWNAEVTGALRAAGHVVFVPQAQAPGRDGAGRFAADVVGVAWADGVRVL